MVHLLTGWIILEQFWLQDLYFATLDVFGACAFIFISGISVSIFFQRKKQEFSIYKHFNKKRVLRNEYLIKGFIILIMAFIAMFSQAIFFSDITWFWNWDILHSLAIAQLLGFIFLKASKKVRIISGIYLLILNLFIFEFLLPYNGELNFFGGLYFFLYNKKMVVNNPLLPSLAVFLLGTVVGEIIHEIKQIENKNERKKMVKNKLLYPSIICGFILMLLGIHHDYPIFLSNRSSSWYFFTVGINLIAIASLFTIEQFEVFKFKKNYRFFYYFSFYSLTVYIFHYLLGFIFLHLLDIYYFIIVFGITVALLALLLNKVHDKYSWKVSIKSIIGKVSSEIAAIIELSLIKY